MDIPAPLIDIEQITPELTWQLRRDILYPGQYKHDMEMAEDAEGTHYGAFFENKLVGVVSLFHKGADHQFRKFAIAADRQGMGIGKQLLAFITDEAAAQGGTRLWCNARLTATGFYATHGFTETGDHFSRNGYDYVIMEKSIAQKTGA